MEKLIPHGLNEVFMNNLRLLPTDGLKEFWIRHALETKKSDPRIYSAIKSLQADCARHSLLSFWYQKLGDLAKAVEEQELEFDACPILNDQIPLGLALLDNYQKLISQGHQQYVDAALKVAQFLETHGGIDIQVCQKLVDIAE